MKPVFVFGSNLGGIHGGGAALFAYKYRGAVMGQASGIMGQNDFSYAIPTKAAEGGRIGDTLPLCIIKNYVDRFIAYAAARPEVLFKLTPIGCGLAGLDPKDVAPMFVDAGPNVLLPDPDFDAVSQEFTEIIVAARVKKNYSSAYSQDQ